MAKTKKILFNISNLLEQNMDNYSLNAKIQKAIEYFEGPDLTLIKKLADQEDLSFTEEDANLILKTLLFFGERKYVDAIIQVNDTLIDKFEHPNVVALNELLKNYQTKSPLNIYIDDILKTVGQYIGAELYGYLESNVESKEELDILFEETILGSICTKLYGRRY